MMRKIRFLYFLLIIILVISACGGKTDESATRVVSGEAKASSTTETKPVEQTNQSETMKSDKMLYFVGEQGYSPISFEENGEAIGIAPDIIREAFGRMGYQVKLEVLPWKRCQEMAEDGSADGFFSPYYNEERNQKYLFTNEPLLVEKNVLLVKKGSGIKFDGDVSKLSDYTWGTITGYATLDKYEEIKKIDYSDSIDAQVEKLTIPERNVDIIVNTNYILWYSAKNLGLSDKIEELDVPLSEYPAYLAFTRAKNMQEIAEEFEKVLIEMKNDGSYDSIIEKYVGAQ